VDPLWMSSTTFSKQYGFLRVFRRCVFRRKQWLRQTSLDLRSVKFRLLALKVPLPQQNLLFCCTKLSVVVNLISSSRSVLVGNSNWPWGNCYLSFNAPFINEISTVLYYSNINRITLLEYSIQNIKSRTRNAA
jgi:hypothetical protein